LIPFFQVELGHLMGGARFVQFDGGYCPKAKTFSLPWNLNLKRQ